MSSTYVRRPWELTTQTPLGAGTGPAPQDRTQTCRMDRAWPPKGRASPSVSSPARNARSTKIRGPSRERRRAVHHYRRYPRSLLPAKAPTRGHAPRDPRMRGFTHPRNQGRYVPKRRVAAPRTSAARGGSRPCGRRASRRRRSRTRSGCSARAGSRPGAARPRSRMTRSGSGWPAVYEVLGDVLDVEHFGQFLDRGAPGGVVLEQGRGRRRRSPADRRTRPPR